jgi:aspartyl aminopeptidase
MGEGVEPFEGKPDVYNVQQKHFTTFLSRVATDLELNVDQIVDFEFSAYDHHRPAIMGLHNEFVASPRLDNLASSLCSLDSLVEYS